MAWPARAHVSLIRNLRSVPEERRESASVSAKALITLGGNDYYNAGEAW